MDALLPFHFMVRLVALTCLAGARPASAQTMDQSRTAQQTESHPTSQTAVGESTAVEDDLEWLVGRWRCVTRQYLGKAEHMISYDAEDSLDYLNVYFPFADDHLTLKLVDSPELRPIAAEFLARFIDQTRSGFNEALQPMSPWGPVRIGKTVIRYGNSPMEDVEFHYRREKRGDWLWLVLESKLMRLELIKLPFGVGDIGASRVVAPIKSYSPERIQRLKRQYAELTKRFQSSSPSTAAPGQTSAKSP